ncbi:MAG TPA: uroporphyrinogen-III C-methyltransferase [Saprospirales bacterium]|nr:uroporphyrinogen-III C-methyltransferase [Saprospirales bacterium]
MSHFFDFQSFNEKKTGINIPVSTLVSGVSKPKLTVVGAGIGDPDHITLKAIKALQTADVVLYDALVNESLLDYAPALAARIFVGKRRGAKSYTQEEIHERIVAYAKCCGHVVRLKGGDPFVFGRGLEELQYAQAYGLETAYVPGISSAIAGAAAAGISVTLRGVSRSFWTITATTDTGELNPDILAAAQSDATVVVLMGLAKLKEIGRIFQNAGKSDWPVAVIQNATCEQQKSTFGTVTNILDQVEQFQIGSPAVIILGPVVEHRWQAEDTEDQALALELLRLSSTEVF